MPIQAISFKSLTGQVLRAAREPASVIKNINVKELKYVPFEKNTLDHSAVLLINQGGKSAVNKNRFNQSVVNALKEEAATLTKEERKIFWGFVRYAKALECDSVDMLKAPVKFYKNISKYQANNVAKRLEETMPKGVPPFEKWAVSYSKRDYKRIVSFQNDNTYAEALRSERPLTKQEAEGVRHLQKIIKKSKPLEKEMTVFRTVQDDFGFAEKLKEGAVIQDKAFLSTSMYWDGIQEMWNAPSWSDTYRLRIHLPKGTKGIACNGTYKPLLGKPNYTVYGNEFVLDKDSKLLVKKIDDKLNIIDMDYLSETMYLKNMSKMKAKRKIEEKVT